MSDSHNDINILHRSPLFDNLAEGRAPEVKYTVNGHNYDMGYYLADGIYPSWTTLVKSITFPIGNKEQYFARAQEAARKDVERTFGVFQSRFAIIRGPGRIWDEETLTMIMRACVIIHNMIVEDDGFVLNLNERFDYGGENVEPKRGVPTRALDEYIDAHRKIRNKDTHLQLDQEQGYTPPAERRPHRAPLEPLSRFILAKYISL
jgi:hypothetical protein